MNGDRNSIKMGKRVQQGFERVFKNYCIALDCKFQDISIRLVFEAPSLDEDADVLFTIRLWNISLRVNISNSDYDVLNAVSMTGVLRLCAEAMRLKSHRLLFSSVLQFLECTNCLEGYTQSVENGYATGRRMTQKKNLLGYAPINIGNVQLKVKYNAQPSKKSIHHTSIAEHRPHSWIIGLDSVGLYDPINYATSSPPSSQQADSTNVKFKVPYLSKVKTLFSEDKTVLVMGSMLCSE